MVITRKCPLCGKFSSVVCDSDAWAKYQNGALAQDAFPDMDTFTRETIISGMCDPCQIQFFIEDDEDDCDGECDVCAEFDCPSNASLFAPWEE